MNTTTATTVRETYAAWQDADAAASANADPDMIGATDEGQEILEDAARALWAEYKTARAAHSAALLAA